MKTHLILYVLDQSASTRFYRDTLGSEPTLDVPGMTEFTLNDHCVLGLMPLAGITRLLGAATIQPDLAAPPRSELYLSMDDAHAVFERAVRAGARVVSPMEPRDWGDVAGYVLDPDGHVVAFAGT